MIEMKINNAFIIIFCLILLFLPYLLFSLKDASIIFDNFNKVAIGLAALITAYFGSSYFFEEVLRKRRIDNYRKMFPYTHHTHPRGVLASHVGILGCCDN